MSEDQDKDFILEEDEVSYLSTGVQNSSSLKMSKTSDTLDSVLLETTPDEKVDPSDVGVSVEVSSPDEEEETNQPNPTSCMVSDHPMQVHEQSSNISSYFASDSSDNFFDSIGNPSEESETLGKDLFMSIAMSKSEEDMQISEMNATEIKDSDLMSESNRSSDLDDFPNLSRNQSQDALQESVENLTFLDDQEEIVVNNLPEKEEEDIIHIRHREHKSSTSEPEPCLFEGESDALQGDQLSSVIPTDLAENDEFQEIVGQAEDIVKPPQYSTQISSTSDKSDSQANSPYNVPSLASSLPDPKLPPTGPVVGTTPSQMSPMGTPVHQAKDSAAPVSPPVNPPGFLAPNSPGFTSQFHSMNQDISGGNGSPSIFTPFSNSGAGDDAFTSILSMSDADRRHDAWIPSDATSHILFSMATNPVGTFTPASEQLSTPGILTNDKQGDPVRDLVLRYMGEQEAIKRSVLTVDSVTHDVDGLKKLIEAGCLRAAIDLTGRLLEQVGQGFSKAGIVTVHTPHSLQLWFVRLTLMVKLRMYEQAEAEMRAFQTLDTPDLYFQFYPNSYPGRRGSMVSFSMRLLHAELPLLCGRSQESLDRLYYMMAVCTRIKSNLSSDLSEDGSATHMTHEARKVSLELWNQRELQILYKIAATMLSVKDYEAALTLYNTLLEKEKNAKLELKAGIGRIYLQMGNINEATKIMKEVETESSQGESAMPCFNLLNKGLVAMSSNNFHDAYQHFKSAVQIQPHNTCAVNNMAVCSLYLGRLKDALNTLEQLVHSDPSNTLHEGVLFNLCTLYELETSRALHKKQAILDLVNKHKGDGFPVACLKMA